MRSTSLSANPGLGGRVSSREANLADIWDTCGVRDGVGLQLPANERLPLRFVRILERVSDVSD